MISTLRVKTTSGEKLDTLAGAHSMMAGAFTLTVLVFIHFIKQMKATILTLLIARETDNGQNNKYKRCVKLYTCGGASSGQSCSGRGLCNYATGTCKCHSGYTGNACESIESKF